MSMEQIGEFVSSPEMDKAQILANLEKIVEQLDQIGFGARVEVWPYLQGPHPDIVIEHTATPNNLEGITSLPELHRVSSFTISRALGPGTVERDKIVQFYENDRLKFLPLDSRTSIR